MGCGRGCAGAGAACCCARERFGARPFASPRPRFVGRDARPFAFESDLTRPRPLLDFAFDCDPPRTPLLLPRAMLRIAARRASVAWSLFTPRRYAERRRLSIAFCMRRKCSFKSRQRGTGQLRSRHCRAWICSSAQMRRQMWQPPVARVMHVAPCFSKCFIFEQFADGQRGLRQPLACTSSCMCRRIARSRFFDACSSFCPAAVTGTFFSSCGWRPAGLFLQSSHRSKSAHVPHSHRWPETMSLRQMLHE